MHIKVSYHSNTVVILSYKHLNSLKLPCKPLGKSHPGTQTPTKFDKMVDMEERDALHSRHAEADKYTCKPMFIGT